MPSAAKGSLNSSSARALALALGASSPILAASGVGVAPLLVPSPAPVASPRAPAAPAVEEAATEPPLLAAPPPATPLGPSFVPNWALGGSFAVPGSTSLTQAVLFIAALAIVAAIVGRPSRRDRRLRVARVAATEELSEFR
jgi:hypothetical protein